MIAFITTIRHPRNSNNYSRVGDLLSNTLRSVLGQTDEKIVVIVVHNQRPDVSVVDSRVLYVEVGFEPPSDHSGPMIEFSDFTRDKGTKCAVGVAVARRTGADHVMFFDADDLLSSRIAEIANRHPDHPGWYFPSGYIYSVGTRSVQLVPNGFQKKNGSTAVIRTDLINLPDSITAASSQAAILDALGPQVVNRLLGNHGGWEECLAEAGHQMEPLKFPGVIWMIGTGENHSGNLVSGRKRSMITPEITAEFTLSRPSAITALRANAGLKAAQLRRKVEGLTQR